MLIIPENSTKNEIRKICLGIRNNIASDLREDYTLSIWNRLYETNEYKRSKCVLLYASIGSEPSTNPLITKALTDGKLVYCPRICGDYMEFVRINSFDLIPTGRYNIPEPVKSSNEEIYKYSEKTICIMPALAVDSDGTRLGYGKGYYDKYISTLKSKETVGCDRIFLICGIFSSLCIKYLPKQHHDIPCDMIITEEETIRIEN
jgi:5-formyltetrahydrofolate cyclo-ligase